MNRIFELMQYEDGRAVKELEDRIDAAIQDMNAPEKSPLDPRRVRAEFAVKSDQNMSLGAVECRIECVFPQRRGVFLSETVAFEIGGDRTVKVVSGVGKQAPLDFPDEGEPERTVLELAPYSLSDEIRRRVEHRINRAAADILDPNKKRGTARKVVLELVLEANSDLTDVAMSDEITVNFPREEKIVNRRSLPLAKSAQSALAKIN